jgi:hypothetical protein
MALSDCPNCWDTPCNCEKGHHGSKNYAYEQLQQENAKMKMRFETALQQRNICLETMRMITGDDELTEKTKNKYDLELESAGE